MNRLASGNCLWDVTSSVTFSKGPDSGASAFRARAMALCMPSSENRKGRRAGSTSRSPNRPTGDDPGGVRVPIDLPEELRALRENGPERELNIDLMNPVPCQVASDGSMEPSEPTRDNRSSGVAEERLPEPVLERAAERLGPEILCGPDLRRTADWLSFAERIGSPREGARFPDFLGIGPTKTGTTWLARHLSQHPHIFVPAEKETGYFTHGWRLRQIDTYEEMFKEAGDRLKGELTPGYALLPSLAIRYIQQLNPQLKLIFLARRLAERASSQTRHSYRHYEMTFRNRTTAGFEELRNAELVADFVADYAVASSDYRPSSQPRHSYRHYEMTFRNRTTAGFEELRNAELVADFVADYAVASSDYRGTDRKSV